MTVVVLLVGWITQDELLNLDKTVKTVSFTMPRRSSHKETWRGTINKVTFLTVRGVVTWYVSKHRCTLHVRIPSFVNFERT